MEPGGALYLIGMIFLAVLAVLWFLLPFAVFGIQPKIVKVLAEMARTNELLTEISAGIKRLGVDAAALVKCTECGKHYSGSAAACPFCGFNRSTSAAAA
jgi:ribosomal protein L37E